MAKAKHNPIKPIKLAIAISVIIIILGTSVIIPKYLSSIAQPLTVAEVTSSGSINLFFDPPTASLQLGSTIDLNLKISTEGSTKATGVTVDLAYDPSLIQIVSVTRGDFFSSALEDADIVSEGVSFTYVTPPSSGGRSGSGTVATIKVKSLKPGSSNISFRPGTVATAYAVEGNTLKSNTGVAISSRIRSDIYPVDVPDNAINLLDYNQLALQFNQTGERGFTPADIDTSGKVDLLDYNILATEYGRTY